MIRLYPDGKGNFRIGNFVLFLEIAIDNYMTIVDNKKLISELEKISDTDDEEFSKDISRTNTFYNKNQKLEIQSLIMLSTFFESLINEIGLTSLGQKYFKSNLDKLSVRAKWEVVLKLTFNKGLDTNREYYKNFIELIKKRNSLVHYKSSILTDHSINSIAELSQFADHNFTVLSKNMKTIHLFLKDLKLIKNDDEFFFGEINKQLDRLKT